MPGLVLASQSPFRRQLLQRLGIPFTSWNADINETPKKGETPQQLVMRLAETKARAFVAREHCLIIGADQIGYVANRVLGKPHTPQQACAQLRLASGKSLMFYTGVALLDSTKGTCESLLHTTRVHFRQLSDREITDYIALEQPLQSCGSFHIEGLGISLIESVESDDPTGLIGLPLIHLSAMLRKAGIAVPGIHKPG